MATTREGVIGVVSHKIGDKLVSELKVEELKAELEQRGLKKSGVKKELQERLTEHLNERISVDKSSTSVSSSSSVNNDKEASSGKQETPTNVHETSGNVLETNDQDSTLKSECEVVKVGEEKTEKDQGKNIIEEDSKAPGKSAKELEDGEIARLDEDKKGTEKTTYPEKKKRISLSRQTSNTTPAPGSRKRKWSSMSSKNKSSVSISTDSLKGLIPGVQLVSTPALEAVMDLDDDKEDEETFTEQDKEEEKKEQEMETEDNGKQEEKNSIKKTRIVHVEESKTVRLNQSAEEDFENHKMDVTPGIQELSNEGMTAGRVARDEDLPSSSSPSSETNFKVKKAVSPPRNPPSSVIHVSNLVRPFTQNQLNQLLSQYGTLVEGGFWINKIKSHCYVTYSSVDEAKAAREALHGQRWPSISPRVLHVDFGDEEQMVEDTEGALGKTKESPVRKGKREDKGKEKEKEKEKETQRHKERKGEKTKDEPSPANLLDKLFRKTTSLPCIYWLPLTKEQILRKEEERNERRKQRQLALREEEKEQDERLKGRERERDSERDKDRGTERERETLRHKERKPLREDRLTSPPSRSRSRRSPEPRNRSRSRGWSSRRNDRRR